MLKVILVTVGTISLGLGILGIFLPLLPTTPFFLLTAACYARSSKRFYFRLMNHRWFGTYIRSYREKRGITLRIKVLALSMLWGTIIYSAIFVVSVFWVQVVLIFVAVAVTIHILSLKTL